MSPPAPAPSVAGCPTVSRGEPAGRIQPGTADADQDSVNKDLAHRDLAQDVVLTIARHLHLNGQATDDTIHAVDRLGRRLGFDDVLMAGWDRVELLTAGEGRPTRVDVREVEPVAMNVARVSALMTQVEALVAGEVRLDELRTRIDAAARLPLPPLWEFAVAAAAGACALAVIFGETRPVALAAIAAAAGLGGLARQLIGRRGAGLLSQDAVAAFIAGLAAALCVRAGLPTNLQLAAACPCMILIPGPHLLNGALDLLFYRVTLGISRLAFAAMALTAISAGLVIGLAVGGHTLPMAADHAAVPFWRDVAAGGVAATCYGVFYAMPVRMLVWPAGVGMLAHAAHWAMQVAAGVSPAPSAALASLLAGVLLVPVTRRFHLPFAGVGFASVVSMLPGIFIFPMSSALLAIAQRGPASSPALVADVIGDGTTAILVVLGMTLGLLCPKSLFDGWRRHAAAGHHPHR